MAFFDRVSRQITATGQNVSQQAKNLAEITKLNGQASSIDKELSERYQALGQAYYERHKNDPTAELSNMINEIAALNADLAQIKERVKQIKGIEKCPQCGADVPRDAAFCSACGYKMIAKPSAGKQFCVHCGTELEIGSLFCTNCGMRVNDDTSTSSEAVDSASEQDDNVNQ